MKKVLVGILIFLFSAAVVFSVGSFLAKRKIDLEAERKITEDVSLKISDNFPEQKIEEEEIKPADETINEGSLPKDESRIRFSFAVLGDTQYFKAGSNGGYQQAVNNIKRMNPNLVFAVGDLVSSCDEKAGCEGKFGAWKSVLGPLVSRTYAAQGNHDRTGGKKADEAWEKAFNYFPANGPEGFVHFVYSLDLENSHFVVLATDKPEENDINKTQLDWLERDLAKNKKENIFVFFHEPAYPTNSKIGESLDESPGDRDRLWNILTKYKARAVFSGHEHIQSRRKVGNIYQFGFGNTESFDHLAPKAGMAEYFHVGQAFGLVEVDEKNITVETYSVQGNLLNSFVLPH